MTFDKEIETMRTMMTTAMLGVALLAAAPQASAFGPRGGHFFRGAMGRGGPEGHGPAGMPLRLLLREMTPDQRAQVRTILIEDRGTMRDTLRQMREAHEALADKMLTAGTVAQTDVDPLVQKIAALHTRLLSHGTKVMLQVRAIATPEQLAKAAETKTKLDALHDQIGAILGGPDAADDDHPE